MTRKTRKKKSPAKRSRARAKGTFRDSRAVWVVAAVLLIALAYIAQREALSPEAVQAPWADEAADDQGRDGSVASDDLDTSSFDLERTDDADGAGLDKSDADGADGTSLDQDQTDDADLPDRDENTTDDEADERAIQELTDREADVLLRINEERAGRDAAPLELLGPLMHAARGHSVDMQAHEDCSHDGTDGSDVADRIRRQDVDAGRHGEIIACGSRTAAQALEQWMGSTPHRKILLDPKYTHFGAGVAGPTGSGATWTVVFAAVE